MVASLKSGKRRPSSVGAAEPSIDRLLGKGRTSCAGDVAPSRRNEGSHVRGEPVEIGERLGQGGRRKAEEEVLDAGARETGDVLGHVGGPAGVALPDAVGPLL